MAADKVSRSVPAPGKGVLTFARETPFAKHSPVLDLQFRRDQMSRLTRSLAHSSGSETDWSGSDSESSSFTMLSSPASTPSELGSADMQMLKRAWSTNLRAQDPDISPLRAALAVWDLTVDDIAFVSMHGTSTKANDKNEVAVINEQMCHLGRNIDQPLLAICQKAITGHPKAPAAAWMLNGCIQAMTHSVVPGNRQVDNIDPIFRQFGHFVLPTQNIAMSSIKAFLLNSFGFGQKGGQLVGVAPRYLFASIQQNQYSRYANKCQQRMQVANRDYVKGILQRNVVKLQSETAYRPTEETQVFLDPLARVAGTISGDLRFDLAGGHSAPISKAWVNQNFEATQANLHSALNLSEQCFSEIAGRNKDNVAGLGVDLVVLSTFQSHENETFLERNFTNREQHMALSSLEPRATFAGRWAAKEAVFKSLGVKSLGAGAAMKDIEIIHRDGHGPRVRLSGRALRMAQSRGLREILISLTYGEDSVVAIAMGIK